MSDGCVADYPRLTHPGSYSEGIL